jgi:tRNA-specific 2-thiouridylase
MASKLNLPVANRSDSQDLCFLGGADYRDFLHRQIPELMQPGKIIDTSGVAIGEHPGLAYFTIGQRKGLGISADQPLYVIDKNISNHTLTVGRANDLGKNWLHAKNANWISGNPPKVSITGSIKIRYKSQDLNGTIKPISENNFEVLFSEPARDITPGQAAVVYSGDECLGGGEIE